MGNFPLVRCLCVSEGGSDCRCAVELVLSEAEVGMILFVTRKQLKKIINQILNHIPIDS